MTVGAAGKALTVTTITALTLSQPFAFVWLTQYEVFPAVVVEGIGAVALPVPPVATVYHRRLVPVAVSAVAVSLRQYVTGVVTVGAAGNGLTVTTITALGLWQPFAFVWLTQYEVLPAVAVEGTGAVALPVPPVATVYHRRFVPVAVSAVAVAFRQ